MTLDLCNNSNNGSEKENNKIPQAPHPRNNQYKLLKCDFIGILQEKKNLLVK